MNDNDYSPVGLLLAIFKKVNKLQRAKKDRR